MDGGGGLGLARNIVQRYALETGSGAGPRLRQEEVSVEVPDAGHFIVLERPDMSAKALNDAMQLASVAKTAA